LRPLLRPGRLLRPDRLPQGAAGAPRRRRPPLAPRFACSSQNPLVRFHVVTPPPARLVVAVFSRHAEAIGAATRRLEEHFGPIAKSGEPYRFHHTDYYAATMGGDLLKQLLLFRDEVPPDSLAGIKQTTIALERDLAESGAWPEPRPVNVDPGLLTLG